MYDFVEKWVPPVFVFAIVLPLAIPVWLLWWLVWILTDMIISLLVPFGSQDRIIRTLKQSWFNPDSDKRERARARAKYEKEWTL